MFMAKRAFAAPFRRLPQINRSILNSTRNLFIQTVETPNEHALKFLPSMQIMKENETREFLSGREAACSPLALKLFSIDGIKSIMFGSNFITIEKADEDLHWSLLKPEIFSILTEFLNNGTPIINEESELTDDMEINEDDDETVTMIKELIFTRIRPAIQDDGGDIEFVSFAEDNGTVYLRLKGACRSCDSSSVTLKNGIESMLKYYIEEVTTVEQVNDDDTTEIVEKFKSEDVHLKPSPRDDPPSL
mmetsp:Transcript_2064/g.2014  ORF Transcript_2064/g.2014 Transcript_2064/m.2014 type:complete len:247 (+) Transcript_2064:196-936(+)